MGAIILLWSGSVPSLYAEVFPGLDQAAVSGDYGSLKSIVIIQNGVGLHEGYYRNTVPADLHHMHSVTKSVGSALVGIAHRQGVINLDDTLEDLFEALYPMQSSPYADKTGITVEALLQQRHGLEVDEWATDYRDSENPVVAGINSGDWYRYLLRLPVETTPFTKFNYSTLGSTAMSRMIRWSTGMGPREFAERELFGPLGIDDFHWELFSSQGRGSGLTDWPNPDEDEPLGFGLWLKPGDMAKIGQLYLDGGLYQGRRILDQSWIEKSWQSYSNSDNTPLFEPNPGNGYGYQWWKQVITDNRGREFGNHYAAGWARQHIMVLPELSLVVVAVSDDYDYDGPGIGALLRTIILPALNPPLDDRFNGAWYPPDMPGQGLNIEILDDGARVAGFFYTYDDSGNKRWFVVTGPVNGDSADLSIIRTEGGAFLEPDPVTEEEWGRGRITTVDCQSMVLEIESEEIVTSVNLTRLTGSCQRLN